MKRTLDTQKSFHLPKSRRMLYSDYYNNMRPNPHVSVSPHSPPKPGPLPLSPQSHLNLGSPPAYSGLEVSRLLNARSSIGARNNLNEAINLCTDLGHQEDGESGEMIGSDEEKDKDVGEDEEEEDIISTDDEEFSDSIEAESTKPSSEHGNDENGNDDGIVGEGNQDTEEYENLEEIPDFLCEEEHEEASRIFSEIDRSYNDFESTVNDALETQRKDFESTVYAIRLQVDMAHRDVLARKRNVLLTLHGEEESVEKMTKMESYFRKSMTKIQSFMESMMDF